MLGQPEAMVPEPLGVPREVEGIVERLRGGGAGDDWREVENGKLDHR
jgi:hypothetical protein